MWEQRRGKIGDRMAKNVPVRFDSFKSAVYLLVSKVAILAILIQLVDGLGKSKSIEYRFRTCQGNTRNQERFLR